MFCSAARHRGPKCVIVKVDESWLCGTGWLDAYIDIHICCSARLLEHIVLGYVLYSICGVGRILTRLACCGAKMFLLSPYFYPAVLKLPILGSVFLPWYLCFYPAGNDDGVCYYCNDELLTGNLHVGRKHAIEMALFRVRTIQFFSPLPLPSFGLSRRFCFGYYSCTETEEEE